MIEQRMDCHHVDHYIYENDSLKEVTDLEHGVVTMGANV